MYTKWTQHIQDENEKKLFQVKVQSSKVVLERLMDILNEEEMALDRSETDIRTFDQPNWAERQAFKNGYRSALGMQKKLINLDQQKELQIDRNPIG